MAIPDEAITRAVDDPAHAIAAGLRQGIRILAPAEAREFLSRHPGSGASVERRERFENGG